MKARAGSARASRWRGRAAALLACSVIAVVSGCGSSRVGGAGGSGGEEGGVSGLETVDARVAMLPTRLAIHPLTRIGMDSQRRPALVLHFELRDQFDQNTRALGVLEVGVQRPGIDPLVAGGGSGGAGDDSLGEATWRVDLGEPERNAMLFDDLVTRTYVITLTDLPEWMIAWSEQRQGVALGLGSPTVAARYTFADPRAPGVGRMVTDSARVGR